MILESTFLLVNKKHEVRRMSLEQMLARLVADLLDAFNEGKSAGKG